MKKTYITLAVASFFLAANFAEAKSGPYVGIDAIYSNVKHRFIDTASGTTIANGLTSDGNNAGVGFNVGYKVAAGKAFIAPEIFYDYLNNSARDFSYRYQSTRAVLEINDRYGAKLNIGYNIFSRVNVFVNAGLTNVHATNRSNGAANYSGYKIAPIYGVGLSYDFNRNIALKASYDYQNFNTKYYNGAQYAGYRNEVVINVFKVGMAYSF